MRVEGGSTGRDRAERRLLLLALALETVFLVLALLGDLRQHFLAFLALNAVAFALYYLAASGPAPAADRRGRALVWLPALGFRLTLVLLGEPSLSGDVHRYVWDGAVLASGLNPYAHAPASPEREAFAPLAARVNHAAIATVYPPLAEALFALCAALARSERLLRLVLALLDLSGTWALARLLRREGGWSSGGSGAGLWWAWCPLVLIEGALSGHIDAVAAALLLWGVAYLSEGRKNASTLLLLASALTKLFALAVALALWRGLGARRALALLALFAAAWLPFFRAGAFPLEGLRVYAARWEFNSPWHQALVQAAQGVDLYFRVQPGEVARLVSVTLFVLAVLALAPGRCAPGRAAGLLAVLFLLLTPTLHPWYGIWGVAFAARLRSRALLALPLLLPLSYAAAWSEAAGRGWVESPAAMALEFGLLVWLLLGDLGAGRFAREEAAA